jgi:hypothetical protein
LRCTEVWARGERRYQIMAITAMMISTTINSLIDPLLSIEA